MSFVRAQGTTSGPLRGVAGLEVFAPLSSGSRSLRRVLEALAWVFFVAALGGLFGCSSSGECRLTSDCPSPLFCVEGLCVAECREDRDCSETDVCREGRCSPREVGQRLCGSALDCDAGETCANGVCEQVRFVSPSPPDAGVGGGSETDAGTPDAGMPAQGPAGLPYGAPCSAASECTSSFCLAPAGTTTGRCTERCVADSDCFFPDTCLDVPGAGQLCGQPVAGKPTGAACPGGPSECGSGLCVDSMDGSGPICTETCSSLSICPPNMTCQPVPDGRGGAVPVCINGSGAGFGEGCAAARDCATNLCVAIGAGGLCTSLCQQVPCPSGWSCVVAEDQSGAFRVCAPDSAVGGRFGDPCTAASACQSNLCLLDPRTSQAFCTEPCVSNADCTSVPGLACVTLLTGARVCGPL